MGSGLFVFASIHSGGCFPCSLRLTLTTRAQIFFLCREQSEVHLYISKVATKRTLTTLQCGVCGYVFVMLAEHILRRRHLYSIFERVDSRPRHCTSTAQRPEENWPLLSQGQVNQASGAVPGVSGEGGEARRRQ